MTLTTGNDMQLTAARGGRRVQRDTPGYGPRRTAEELRRDLAAAKRYADR
jgi:8-hydroxy-5-deazaflavin:NADPH oxidoreductase